MEESNARFRRQPSAHDWCKLNRLGVIYACGRCDAKVKISRTGFFSGNGSLVAADRSQQCKKNLTGKVSDPNRHSRCVPHNRTLSVAFARPHAGFTGPSLGGIAMQPAVHFRRMTRTRRFGAVLGSLNLAVILLGLLDARMFSWMQSLLGWFGITVSGRLAVILLAADLLAIVFVWFVLPWTIFRWLIPARCPNCAAVMYLEVGHPPRYCCRVCGHCHDDGTMKMLAQQSEENPLSAAGTKSNVIRERPCNS